MTDWRRWLGERGENVAERYLRRCRFAIVERNYRCPAGEIDLIALDGRVLVFIEVKTRRHQSAGTPAEAVDRRKRRRIARAAEHYMSRFRLHGRLARFDVVEVVWTGDEPRIELIRNAFEVER